MALEIVLKYTLCYAVLLLVSPTTFADEASSLPSTMVIFTADECHGYQSNYTLSETCNSSRVYRTIDGSCNNEEDPIRGKSFTPFKRFLRSDYQDYVHMPVTMRPDPRDLSIFLFKGNTNESLEEKVNAFFVTYGQFIIHDLAFVQPNIETVKCCPDPTNTTECMPDAFMDDAECHTYDPNCFKFIRSLGVGPISGDVDPREQLNRITHFMDGSLIYGSSQEELDSLRDAETGKLKVTDVGNNPLLPTRKHIMGSNSCPFFDAGDTRANENSVLGAHHVLWVREHNAILDELFSLHQNWTKEKLFQETRRIVVAELQHITYEEFLPLLVGQGMVKNLQLYFNSNKVYQSDVDATISNAFTTAAFRYGHVMLDDFIFFDQTDTDQSRRNASSVCERELNSFSCNSTHTITLEESLKSADRIYSCENSIDAIIVGSIKRSAQKSNDMRAAETLRTKLVNTDDLISINIQRGRDHGIPAYQEWRNWCELDPIIFDHPSNTHTSCILRKLKMMYETEDAIDLYVGGVLENRMDDAVLGPTFACIVANQFYDTKFGDRFWYENDQFTADQLKEISRQTMSMLILRNTNISSIPANSFVIPSDDNIPEETNSAFNLTAWN